MKKLLTVAVVAFTLGAALFACNGSKSGDSTKEDVAISKKAGEMVGSQFTTMMKQNAEQADKIDVDEFYKGFEDVFSRLDTTKENSSYVVGTQAAMQTVQMLMQSGIDFESIDKDAFLNEFKKALDKKKQLTPEQMQSQQTELDKLIAKGKKAKAAENLKKGEKYMKDLKGYTKTASGIMYKFIKKGAGGANFTDKDVVNVVYVGTHIDGKEFDSSQGQPRPMPVQGVIPGMQEMLKLMKPGDKVEVVIPGKLAYGDDGNQVIAPGETLIFTLEAKGLYEQPKQDGAGAPGLPGAPGAPVEVKPAQAPAK